MNTTVVQAPPACAASGFDTCCAEAQADGVPCAEIRDCEKCGRALRTPAEKSKAAQLH